MNSNACTEKARGKQQLLGLGLVLLVPGGWLYPPLGYFMIVCMVMAMGIGVVKGRQWCDWMCPRGSFWDAFLGRFSRNVKAPAFFRGIPFRLLWLGILMTMLAVNLIPLWPDLYLMGKPFVMILTVTTGVGLGRGKTPLAVTEECVGCGLCEKVCRMGINPGSYRETGIVTDGDCLKCGDCVENCPKQALGFPEPSGRRE